MHLSNKSEDSTMDALEPKKLALIRILQILKTHSDFNHPLTQEDISHYLENDYGIFIERSMTGYTIMFASWAVLSVLSVALLLPGTPCLCIDRVALEEGSFLDIGQPVGPALPVVVKTLVLSGN